MGCTLSTKNTEIIKDNDQEEINVPVVDPSFFSDCSTACEHYVDSCLSLDSDSTSVSLKGGEEFCLKDCQKWDVNKVNCVANAVDCEAMANYCGL